MTVNSADSSSVVDQYLPGASAATGTAPQALFNVMDFRAMLWRQRYVIGITLVSVLVLGLVVTLLMKPEYQATSTVRVDLASETIVEGQSDLSPDVSPSDVLRYLETLSAVIESRSMAGKVADRLHLEANPSVIKEIGIEPVSGGPSKAQAKLVHEKIVNLLQSHVSVSQPGQNRILSINYSSGDAAFAAQVANAYADTFVEDNVSRGLNVNSYARSYLEKQIVDVRQQLSDAERLAIAYARANRITLDTTPTSDSSSSSSDSSSDSNSLDSSMASSLSSVSSAYSDARTRRILAEQRWETYKNAPPMSIADVRNNPAVQTLVGQKADIIAQLSDLRQRYGNDYPQIKELNARLKATDDQLNSLSAQIKQGIHDDYVMAQRQEQSFSQEVSRVTDETLAEQDRRVQYNLLYRNVSAYRSQLSALLDRYNQVSAAATVRNNTLSKLDNAQIPVIPFSPNPVKNMVAALAIGLFFAIGLAILREAIDNKIRSTSDVEDRLGAPLLGIAPYVEDDVDNEIGRPQSPISEAYSSIRTRLEYAMPKKGTQIIHFTSTEQAEGKSISAISVATAFARTGKRVLLIDADLRRPSVGYYFPSSNRKIGLLDVLVGKASFDDVRFQSETPGLTVLFLGTIPPNPVEMLSSPLLGELLTSLEPQFDTIILDGAPVLGLADAPLTSRFADGVVFVTEANRARIGAAKASMKRLQDVGSNVVGIILTKYKAREAGQDYAYQYNYYMYGNTES